MRWRNAQGDQRQWIQMPTPVSELLQHEVDHLDGVLALDRALSDGDGLPSTVERSLYLTNRQKYDAMVIILCICMPNYNFKRSN